MKYLIAGHGSYPEDTLKTIEFLLGKRDDVLTVSAQPDNNNYRIEIDEIIEKYKNEGLIVFTDVLAGSVNQYCMKKLADYDFKLITGYNVAMLLEILLQDDLDDDELNNIIETAKQQLIYCNELMNNI